MTRTIFRAQNPDLETLGADLVKRLGGIWKDDRGMCLCPAHADRNPSLSVRVGKSALLFKCFAGCDNRDVLRAIAKIDEWALQKCPEVHAHHTVPAEPSWRRARVRDLWDRSLPLPGTLAAAYLRRRGLVILPPALRFCGRTPLGRGRDAVFRPAMNAAIHEGHELVAVQRTFFEIDHPRRARDLGNPRRMLGRPRGGAVMLAPVGTILGLAEGIETAVSAMVLLDIPVWATLGSERLARIVIPVSVTHLILLPDNDNAGRIGAAKALEAYAMPGRTIELIWPPAGCKDWNDALRSGEEGVGSIWRQVA
ncbi:DUF7146 domain-containing protein [Novosphingobium album (ex Liu et al. 2023)]|uniref:Toprim domain-containing protein n=1 Tax=Novosphingobium album (ex Liu et al. 2023) TaxID=3031130 RepID=A0ABT5WQI8_9SPHN|nr:toprim domain-containing protein [Novosphingobium album (ex Liu et al. 2023)]MDE8652310.1 toprim domain-containing protein [Novosphingobium album (ex Liu et al. 2023)]